MEKNANCQLEQTKPKKLIIVCFIIITLLQVIGIIYAVSKREYYHMDEYISYGLVQYKNTLIYNNEDFLNNWHNKEYYEDYLTINNEEKWNFLPVYKNQAQDVHPPVYYFLLRLANMFNINNFSIWSGTILNIIIYIFASVFLFLISEKIFKNPYIALIVCAITGFSLACIETVMYVRMYELLVLNILMLIYWHIKNKDVEKLELKQLLPLALVTILGFLTHYYFCIIAVSLFICYVAKCLKIKNYHNLIYYVSTVIISAICGIIIFPYSIIHIFFGYRGQEVGNNLINFSRMPEVIKEYWNVIKEHIFNNNIYAFIGFFIIITVVWLLKKNKIKNKINNSGIIYITIPLIIFLCVSIVGSPYVDLRYLMPIVPLVFCTLIYVITDILSDIITIRKNICVMIIITLLFGVSVIPKLANNAYTYKGSKEVLTYIEQNLSHKPLIYLYDIVARNGKIMECFEAFTKVDETYMMDNDEFTEDELTNVLNNKDVSNGITIMFNVFDREEMLEKINKMKTVSEPKYAGHLGRYVIYELNVKGDEKFE